MAKFSTAQKEVLEKLSKEGSASVSQIKNIMENAAKLKRLNTGGVTELSPIPLRPAQFIEPTVDTFNTFDFYKNLENSKKGELNTILGNEGLKLDTNGNASDPKQRQQVFDFFNKDKTTYQKYNDDRRNAAVQASEYQKQMQDLNAKNFQGQQQLVQKATQDPAKLVTEADVDTISSTTAGTTVGSTTGQIDGTPDKISSTDSAASTASVPENITADTVTASTAQGKVQEALEGVERDYKRVSAADAGFIPPPSDATVTMAIEFFHNPTTGEEVMVPHGGFTPSEGFVKGRPEGKFKTEGVTAAEGQVSDEAQVTAAEGEVSEDAKADAAKMNTEYVKEVTSGERQVSSDELAAAQGLDEEAVKTEIAEANVPDNIQAAQTTVQPEEIPEPAQIAESEMAAAEAMTMEGLTDDATAVAAKLKSFNVDDGTLAEFKEGKIEAQDTVQGQLASLMKQFDDGTPVWAAGALRSANSAMAARGLGGSSMAAAAIVQACMESAIPIASSDAQAFRTMKMDNLSRQQQVSLANAAAQQGVELANFNAEQQVALQNSQNAFSLQSQNLSNMQQAVIANAQIKASLQGQNLSNQQQANMAEAARYAEVNNINLNNRQQGILQDNTNEMQINLANMNAKQQAYVANAHLEAALQGKKIDNQQQVAITNAARYADAANITFTAAEQAKIHNSELMKTIGLAELSAQQAATLQNAATIAAMDMANLSNAQQAAVQNAQAFLQMDMTNLSNEQQTTMFKAQAIQQTILSDTAAENAAKQFNASSENQTKQFMANIKNQTSQFNAAQKNAIAQFNAGEKNAAAKFNAQIKEQRNQFNATNALVVAQANAQWKQNVATLNTAAQNEANSATAAAANAFTNSTMDQIWQRERDLMDYAYKANESDKDRALDIILADKKYDEYAKARKDQEESSKWNVLTQLVLGR